MRLFACVALAVLALHFGGAAVHAREPGGGPGCIIIGDSIAVGSAEAVGLVCSVDAKIGIGSAAIIGRTHDAGLVVISAGSNDPANPNLRRNLETIRGRILGRVLWIVPVDGRAARAVRAVAAARSDATLSFAPGRDHVHPASYRPIADAIRRALQPKAADLGGRPEPIEIRDLGQWGGADPALKAWYEALMQPDVPTASCCGEADAYFADEIHVRDGKTFAVITDDRDDAPRGRPHIDVGTEIEIPDNKLKWDRGNPTGHGVIFLSRNRYVYCYVQPGGA